MMGLRLELVCWEPLTCSACRVSLTHANQNRPSSDPEECCRQGVCPSCGSEGFVNPRNRRHVLKRFYKIQEGKPDER